MKTCNKCKLEKEDIYFYKDKRQKGGLYPSCKECKNKYLYVHRRTIKGKLVNKNHYYSDKHKEYLNKTETKISKNLRTRVYIAIKNNQKVGSTISDLGCTVDELKNYLSYKFTKGMSWDNYGEWHIDHIKPLASFDLTNREEFLVACNYKNLQPLWKFDNLSKGSRSL